MVYSKGINYFNTVCISLINSKISPKKVNTYNMIILSLIISTEPIQYVTNTSPIDMNIRLINIIQIFYDMLNIYIYIIILRQP